MAKKDIVEASDAAASAPKQAAEAPKKVDSDRKARWAAFLAAAEAQRTADGTHAVFLAQQANHEFDVIPDSFL